MDMYHSVRIIQGVTDTVLQFPSYNQGSETKLPKAPGTKYYNVQKTKGATDGTTVSTLPPRGRNKTTCPDNTACRGQNTSVQITQGIRDKDTTVS